MGLDKKLQPCNYFSEDAILRGKIDFTIKDGNKILVVDWKSGKVKEQACRSFGRCFTCSRYWCQRSI